MSSIQSNRKKEHVALSEKYYDKSFKSPFDDLRFVHHSVPQAKVSDVDLSTELHGLKLDFPFYINAMTGGSEWTGDINENLAIIARETGLAMATGSISVGLREPGVVDSFKVVRKMNPDGIVITNLGAGHGLENAKKAIDIMEADAFQIHLNTPQEIVMPEGDRDFTDWESNIQEIASGIDVPLIVKEVGFGMSRETIEVLRDLGVRNIDISGRGGTNFSQIENFRRKDFSYIDIEDWGQTTPVSLLEASEFVDDLSIIASGGVRRPLDVVKSLALGADSAAFSSYVLHILIQEGVDEAISAIEGFKEEVKGIFTLLGAKNINDLRYTDLIISGETRDWADARGIDYKSYAKRSQNK